MRTDATMVDSSRTITPGSFSSPRSSISPEGNSRPRLSEKDWDQWTPRSTPWNPAKTPFSALVHHDWEGSGTKVSERADELASWFSCYLGPVAGFAMEHLRSTDRSSVLSLSLSLRAIHTSSDGYQAMSRILKTGQPFANGA